jgi:hypothetical protein
MAKSPKERISALETWTKLHPEAHRLESSALDIASSALARRLEELNDVRMRFVSKEVFEKSHEILASRVEKLERTREAQTGERGILKYLWQTALVAIGWLIHQFMWK